jgi:transmembrane sensor
MKDQCVGSTKTDLEAMRWAKSPPTTNETERREFANWVLASPRHLEAFLRHEALGAALRELDPGRRIDLESLLPSSEAAVAVAETSTELLTENCAMSVRTQATDMEHRACEWMLRSEGGNLTEEMRADLERWLLEPRHRITFLRIREAWRRASRMRTACPLDGIVDPDLLKNAEVTFRSRDTNSASRWPFRFVASAALTLILCLVGLSSGITLRPTDWIKYTTSVGSYENIALADGSGIQLNTDSEIRARLTPDRREIEVIRGEALIKAVRDTRRPFTVSAANLVVHANSINAAASFTVRLRAPTAVDVSVKQGSVVLGPSEKLVDVALRRDPFSHSTLVEGEMAVVRPEGIHLDRVGLEEINRKLSWTTGLLSFQGETLSEATDEFNRYNRKRLIITNPSIANHRIGGAFQATDPEAFVSALQKCFRVRVDVYGSTDSNSAVIQLSKAD